MGKKVCVTRRYLDAFSLPSSPGPESSAAQDGEAPPVAQPDPYVAGPSDSTASPANSVAENDDEVVGVGEPDTRADEEIARHLHVLLNRGPCRPPSSKDTVILLDSDDEADEASVPRLPWIASPGAEEDEAEPLHRARPSPASAIAASQGTPSSATSPAAGPRPAPSVTSRGGPRTHPEDARPRRAS